jgi:hypothetical protein
LAVDSGHRNFLDPSNANFWAISTGFIKRKTTAPMPKALIPIRLGIAAAMLAKG